MCNHGHPHPVRQRVDEELSRARPDCRRAETRFDWLYCCCHSPLLSSRTANGRLERRQRFLQAFDACPELADDAPEDECDADFDERDRRRRDREEPRVVRQDASQLGRVLIGHPAGDDRADDEEDHQRHDAHGGHPQADVELPWAARDVWLAGSCDASCCHMCIPRFCACLTFRSRCAP